MTIRTALERGWRTARSNWKILALYYLVNLAAAVVIVAPVALVLVILLGGTMEDAALFRNLDASWVAETVLRLSPAPFNSVVALFAAVAFLFLLVETFLAGGAITAFYAPGESFFAGAARRFPRFFRILLVSLLFYFVVIAAMRSGLSAVTRASEDSMELGPYAIGGWIVRAVALLLFFLVNTIFDYAKIVCVVEDRNAIASTRRALRFTFRNFGAAYGVFLVIAILGLALLAVYAAISEWIGQSSIAAVLALLIVRQAYIALRFAFRLWTWAAELNLYSARKQQELRASIPHDPCVWPTELWSEPDADTDEYRRAREHAVRQIREVLPRDPGVYAIAVSGSGAADDYANEAFQLGHAIAARGYDLITGGMRGVMFHVTCGFLEQGQGTAVGVIPKGREEEADALRGELGNVVQIRTQLPGFDTFGARDHIGPGTRNHVILCPAAKVILMPGSEGSIAEARLAARYYNKPVVAYDPGGHEEEYASWRATIAELGIPVAVGIDAVFDAFTPRSVTSAG